MASSKDIQQPSRPLSQHRLSMSTSGSSLPVRQNHSRTHSHSISSGSLNPTHRVTRRKSVTSNTVSNVAAMVAAVREAGDHNVGMPITGRRNTMSKSASARAAAMGSLPSPPASLPTHRNSLSSRSKLDRGDSAIDDDEDNNMEEEDNNSFSKARIRRASEGQHLMKGDKKSGNGDLKCDKCGKGYKHSSCLSKHLWEHTPEWSFTSKLLISKHQQVQLLEAASVLVAMNQEAATPPDSAKDFQSDRDSASPAASGSSEQHDGTSSADTTPPPQADAFQTWSSGSYTGRQKRYSSGYSRSYQSAPSAQFQQNGGSVPAGSGFRHYRQQSHEWTRPPSSGIGGNGDDEGLAAAVELLSCSFGSAGTPRTAPVTIPEDAPPVPHIPAQYLNGDYSSMPLTAGQHPRQTESYTRGQVHHDGDVKMEESEDSIADEEDYDLRSRARSDEDDEGVFGRMEE